jgi:hypothetical protein
MAGDCGIELRKHNVAMLSLMVGAVKTELISEFRDGVTVTINPKSKQVYVTFDPVLYQELTDRMVNRNTFDFHRAKILKKCSKTPNQPNMPVNVLLPWQATRTS